MRGLRAVRHAAFAFAIIAVSSTGLAATITVDGEGMASAAADRASFSINVSTLDESVSQAESKAAMAVNKVLSVIANLPHDEGELNSSSINIRPEYRWNRAQEKQVFIGYRVDRVVSFELTDISDLGDAIQRLSETEVATMMVLRLAGAHERAATDDHEAGFLRLASAVGKYWLTKRSSAVVREALECVGGNGYVEEAPLARYFRESPLNAIWEGSGNVMALDVLRALQKAPEALEAVLAEFTEALGSEDLPDATPEPSDTQPEDPEGVAIWQARYLEVVGRPTGSSNVRYLRWKIRQAERGLVPVGPTGHNRTGEPVEHKVLPLRLAADAVAGLDEARERQGLKSRMELFRRALHLYLTRVGEHEAAEPFAPRG